MYSKSTEKAFVAGDPLRTWWRSSRRSPDPLLGWGGGQPKPNAHPSTPSASRYRRLRRLVSMNHLQFFPHATLDYSAYNGERFQEVLNPYFGFYLFLLEPETVLRSDSEKHNITGRMDQHYVAGGCCPSCPLAGTNVRALRGLTSRLIQTRVYFANCRGILKGGGAGGLTQWLHDSPQLAIW